MEESLQDLERLTCTTFLTALKVRISLRRRENLRRQPETRLAREENPHLSMLICPRQRQFPSMMTLLVVVRRRRRIQ